MTFSAEMQAVHRVVGTLRPRCLQPELACPHAIGPDGRADSDIMSCLLTV